MNPDSPKYAIELADVLTAATRISPHTHETPVLTCSTLDRLANRALLLKCENFQKVGAFKYRGACNAVLNLPDESAAKGVATHSSGNHAQALALAAANRGIAAHIVMPNNAPVVKRRAVADYGGTIYMCQPTLENREKLAAEVVKQTGATFIPPFDHADIMAGQGTVALELIAQAHDLDAIVAPVGGGGLVSGICRAARGVAPNIRLFAAEPVGANDAARSMNAGQLIPVTDTNTIADGLLTSLGTRTWPIIRDHVERVITVTDAQIVEAMRPTWERMKIVIEPSAAVALAATLTDEFMTLEGLHRVGVVFSGGNVDLDTRYW